MYIFLNCCESGCQYQWVRFLERFISEMTSMLSGRLNSTYLLTYLLVDVWFASVKPK